jgi:hypothetical protein
MSDEAALELTLRLKGVRRPGAGEKHLAVFQPLQVKITGELAAVLGLIECTGLWSLSPSN